MTRWDLGPTFELPALICLMVLSAVALFLPANGALISGNRMVARWRRYGFVCLVLALGFTVMAWMTWLGGLIARQIPFYLETASGLVLLVALAITFRLRISVNRWSRHKKERVLRLRNEELQAAQTLQQARIGELEAALKQARTESSAKSAFMASLSHELRTPLNAVIGFTDIMAAAMFGPIGNERYEDYVKLIHNSGTHCLELIGDVLDFTKMEAGRLELDEEVVAPRALLSESVDMMCGWAAKRGLEICLHFYHDLPDLLIDRRRMRQVLLNLLSNAIKFSREGGLIAVSADLTARGVEFIVSDTGVGMASEEIPRALEKFGQVNGDPNRRLQGTGLGLPIAKQLLELHQGWLIIDSGLGVGTTVRCIIPIQRAATAGEIRTGADKIGANETPVDGAKDSATQPVRAVA